MLMTIHQVAIHLTSQVVWSVMRDGFENFVLLKTRCKDVSLLIYLKIHMIKCTNRNCCKYLNLQTNFPFKLGSDTIRYLSSPMRLYLKMPVYDHRTNMRKYLKLQTKLAIQT